jgi:hypothetical protein
MLTRAFLLLLALVSGLSAAQAVDGMRAGQSAEISGSLQALAQAEATSADQAVLTRPEQAVPTAPNGHELTNWVASDAPVVRHITTRLSDRLRA